MVHFASHCFAMPFWYLLYAFGSCVLLVWQGTLATRGFWGLDFGVVIFGFGVWTLEFGFGFQVSLIQEGSTIRSKSSHGTKPNGELPGLRCLVLVVVYGLAELLKPHLCSLSDPTPPSITRQGFWWTSSQLFTELVLLNCVAVVCGPTKLEEHCSLVTSCVDV